MKKLWIGLLGLSLATGVKAQVVLLDENFDNGFPATWQNVDMDSLTPHASVAYAGSAFTLRENPDNTGAGDSIVIATSWFEPAGTAANYLITPAITLEPHGNQLFWQARSFDPSYPESYQVLVSTTTPDIDSFHVHAPLFSTTLEYPDWQDRSLNLDAYAGQQIYLAFYHNSTHRFIFGLNNIRVESDPALSTEDANRLQPALKIWPNPVSDQLFIALQEMPVHTVNVYDLSGRQVLSASFADRQPVVTLSVHTLLSGVYLLETVSEAGVQHSRFVKP